jgi:hypothetical protein
VSAYAPDVELERRSGLLGTPRTLQLHASASAEQLVARDPGALTTIRLGAIASARWIAERRREKGLMVALFEYLELGGSLEPTRELEEILWAYVVLLGRLAPAEKLDALQEAARGR